MWAALIACTYLSIYNGYFINGLSHTNGLHFYIFLPGCLLNEKWTDRSTNLRKIKRLKFDRCKNSTNLDCIIVISHTDWCISVPTNMHCGVCPMLDLLLRSWRRLIHIQGIFKIIWWTCKMDSSSIKSSAQSNFDFQFGANIIIEVLLNFCYEKTVYCPLISCLANFALDWLELNVASLNIRHLTRL